MTIREISENRYQIVFEALMEGCEIPLSSNRKLYFDRKKRELSLSKYKLIDFLDAIKKLSDEELKRLYGDTRLFRLQEKLTKKENE